jgi:lysophospholipase L1-like esterase
LRIARIVSLLVAGSVAFACPVARAAQGPVLVVGDSLAVGMRPFLIPMLGDRDVAWDSRTGRTTPQGLQVLRATLPQITPATVVVSLGTNDGSDPRRFADRIRRVLLALPPRACVIWPTIIRPPRKGPYAALDRVLRDQARRDPRFVAPSWDYAVLRGNVRLPDGVHPDDFGFLYRSRMIAKAIRAGCDDQARRTVFAQRR